MAGTNRLMLSALKTNLPCSLSNNVSQKRCLIHVKLTDFCMKTVEHLIDSEKGAYFSLQFDENGGTGQFEADRKHRMSIPVEHGDTRVFQFKTAPLREGERQSSLECVHQASPSPADHLLSCWGVMEHRLTVQGTDEVYERTKQQMEIAEKLRKEQRTQEIEVPTGRKIKTLQPVERISPVPGPIRKHNRPIPPLSKSTVNSKVSGLVQVKQHCTQPPKIPTTSDTKPKSAGRSTYSLKDRVIHMLALKPQTREHVVAKLKKATKRSETAMSNLDSILQEVSEISQGTYKLKSKYLKSLEVEQWPFYSGTQKQMLKRLKHLGGTEEHLGGTEEIVSEGNPSSLSSSKRPNGEQQYEKPSKKIKLSQPISDAPPLKHVPSIPNEARDDVAKADVSSVMHLEPGPVQYTTLHVSKKEKEEFTGPNSKIKVKKKKKKKREDVEVVATDPTSTTSTPDHLSQFPTLICEEERQRYKQIFNKEYVDYLKLKDSIDQVAGQNQKECSALSERLDSVAKLSDEYKEVKKLIQAKYREFQRNRSYLENKNKFDELHQKLTHIKQMVLQYDAKHRTV